MNAMERDRKESQVRRTKERKGIKPQRVKHPTSFRAMHELIEDEYQSGKQKTTKRKKQ